MLEPDFVSNKGGQMEIIRVKMRAPTMIIRQRFLNLLSAIEKDKTNTHASLIL